MFEEQRSLGSERDAARRAFEQASSQRLFESVYATAQGRLRNKKFFRSRLEAQPRCNGNEASQLFKMVIDSLHALIAYKHAIYGFIPTVHHVEKIVHPCRRWSGGAGVDIDYFAINRRVGCG
jgi:hypothetical protein